MLIIILINNGRNSVIVSLISSWGDACSETIIVKKGKLGGSSSYHERGC